MLQSHFIAALQPKISRLNSGRRPVNSEDDYRRVCPDNLVNNPLFSNIYWEIVYLPLVQITSLSVPLLDLTET